MTPEDRLQSACVRWFRYQYPQLSKMLFAVANQRKTQSLIEGSRLKMIGVTSGVSDLILLTPRNGYGSLCIELKDGKRGRQSPAQHEWELSALSNGNKYVICRTFDEFKTEVEQYLNQKQ